MTSIVNCSPLQQLQLLQKIQNDRGIITVATDFVGDQSAVEGTLADVQVWKLRLTECSVYLVY